MNLKDDSYVIYMGTQNFTEKHYKDNEGWLKISARGKEFRMTAEQVLNHLLPALAGIKPNLTIKVEHNKEDN
ncbi:hypothetical protein A2631_05060 [Candidatus Daviesbacteria bacterium RIFCSPHIGHO2_01_FULL_44_29]|uniref:Uncharacterized protein n=1 Tax=Candidatus Daviesbacteria bacterium RIFCSPHIGHO2_02_FULL_43_12 TaxID=1797776 RepID=A0A1F5KHK6_9BACT|nr:MAG: hypothetical protein A2631_05060 [Candidatus Daviesbacteria bacterium RIFCSPHIGHO2_01_FULL_44_29]OGE40091.1 MAG: hypothetical protein A3D25_04790 [Candidatus Daviesbacteria bacterium RIFCSPHIGHO2_02_FULL_43_12]OGE41039.1 MAG: hypothetical protein A3E86_04885 [Candidatus Daviesbacteria bacterium RIFCSPHIGHO2_12_FULL_47_45]OGE70229.1 MAG: hypothetical protein A3B55_00780 [Candidatus Daviesbacteria bacterium RIFCSPLOWO2_01_FULL_43_15]